MDPLRHRRRRGRRQPTRAHRAASARSPPWLHATCAAAPRATVAHASRAAVPRAAVSPHDAVALRDPSWPREPPWAPPCAPPESGATAPCRRKERKDDGEGGGAMEGEGGRCTRGRRRGCDRRRGTEVWTCSDLFGLRQKPKDYVFICEDGYRASLGLLGHGLNRGGSPRRRSPR